ncbi:MAG: 3-hydroxyacyl-CoA dehydrogenase NAD-binding domain-containing protein [Roseinatronobacter sp.]
MAMRIWVLGGGLIGGGWAVAFAAAGHDVTVIDPAESAPARLSTLWQTAIPVMERAGIPAPRRMPEVRPAADGPAPDWVQECLPEDLALKQEALQQLELLLRPDTIIASSSSGLSPDAIAAALVHPERVVIAHPCNPSYLMPVVEICGGTKTPDAVLDQAEEMFTAMGRTVLRLNRAMPGHLVNRLQAALWREAVFLAREGVASVGDIERAVTLGLGPRWSIIGPSTVFHISGGEGGMAAFLDALGNEFERWWATLGTPTLDAETRRFLVDAMARADRRPVSEIAAARDAALPELLAFLEKQRRRLSVNITKGGNDT